MKQNKVDTDVILNTTHYLQVLDLEQEKGEWGFKALKQMIKINFKLVSFQTILFINND